MDRGLGEHESLREFHVKKQLDAITHEVIGLIERRIEMENLFPQSPVKAFDTVDRLVTSITAMDQIEEVAERAREAWDLGFDPIPGLIDVLETNGITHYKSHRAKIILEATTSLTQGVSPHDK